MNSNLSDLEIHILVRLFRHGYIGRRHTAREEMKQGLPKHLRDMSEINRACNNLINSGYLIPQHGSRIAINPERTREIVEIVRQIH